MNNYELARIIVDDVMSKFRSSDGIMYMEYVRSVETLLNNAQRQDKQVLHFSDMALDTGSCQAMRGNRTISLTAKEYYILELFMRNPVQVLTRDTILSRVWVHDYCIGASNVVDVYMGYLRRKLERDGEPRLLHTVRGMGYILRDPMCKCGTKNGNHAPWCN